MPKLKILWYDVQYKEELTALMAECFPNEAWNGPSFKRFTARSKYPKRSNVIKVLVDRYGKVYSAMFYTMMQDECRIRRIGTPRQHRNQGYATRLIESLMGPKSLIRREHFAVRVKEDDLRGQTFFRDNKTLGFKFDPTAIERDALKHITHCTFRFHKTLPVLAAS
jgi:hypothetical protein